MRVLGTVRNAKVRFLVTRPILPVTHFCIHCRRPVTPAHVGYKENGDMPKPAHMVVLA